MDLLYWTALSVGFFGSFHCAGMCGPLALALPAGNGSILSHITGRLLYNLGRVFTYATLGAVAGLLGRSFSIRGWQSDISIFSGVLIIVMVLLSNKKISGMLNQRIVGISFHLKGLLKSLLRKHSLPSLFAFGAVNGILPCGFVYLALAGAATTKSPAEGVLYMILFGMGTIPMMFTIALSGSLLTVRARNTINKITPFIAIALAVFLIHRGSVLRDEEHSCCKPDHARAFETKSQ